MHILTIIDRPGSNTFFGCFFQYALKFVHFSTSEEKLIKNAFSLPCRATGPVDLLPLSSQMCPPSCSVRFWCLLPSTDDLISEHPSDMIKNVLIQHKGRFQFNESADEEDVDYLLGDRTSAIIMGIKGKQISLRKSFLSLPIIIFKSHFFSVLTIPMLIWSRCSCILIM